MIILYRFLLGITCYASALHATDLYPRDTDEDTSNKEYADLDSIAKSAEGDDSDAPADDNESDVTPPEDDSNAR